mmetsp:Transcript_28146/g.51468  ORF Transcript_28146/g.51468 Transcript_28146/m.51468 type:complete len:401 (-) Transcript_28146:100-1302(-)
MEYPAVIPTIAKVSTQRFKGVDTIKYTFGKDTLECPNPAAGLISSMGVATGLVSPWTDAKKDGSGKWILPAYDCEIKGLDGEDPKNTKWTPGEYGEGIDNVMNDSEGNKIKEWNGFGVVDEDTELPFDPSLYPEVVQNLVKVPHMPGQPMKEMFARLKAVEPSLFEDKYANDILKALLPEWKKYSGYTKWAESFGIHTDKEPGEWAGQQMEVCPSAYVTPRADAVTICVGIAKEAPKAPPKGGALAIEEEEDWPVAEVPGAEFDFLTHLYAKDQEGKVFAIFPYESHGIRKVSFATVSIVPPKGTQTITPYASFKIRGVWRGRTIEWNPEIENEAMQWFTDMTPETRKELADPNLLSGESADAISNIRYKKSRKQLPVLWPENSWEGNALKARMWDQLNK